MARSRFANLLACARRGAGTALGRVLVLSLYALAGAACAASLPPPRAELAWLRDGVVEWRNLDAKPAGIGTGLPMSEPMNGPMNGPDERRMVPLGSLWKLFVYTWLVDQQANEAPYRCSSVPDAEQQRYCCQPGQSVSRDLALARSCAPYFEPKRLGLLGKRGSDWQSSTAEQGSRPRWPWLADVRRLQPATEVPLDELLAALAAISPAARASARSALLQTGIEGYGRDAWRFLGSGIRYKTYSWQRKDGRAFGGAAGWLADGTPFWFGASGSSRTSLTTWAGAIAQTLPAPQFAAASAGETGCVDVDFFTRYPLTEVVDAARGNLVKDGPLQGRYRLLFANGNRLNIVAQGDMRLAGGQISARFGLNDYLARVIEREGSSEPREAARVLAIVARSYLLQNATFASGCWQIADSTRTQRVSPNPPGAAALAASWFTDEMILTGSPVQYHLNTPGRHRLSWQETVTRAKQGQDFEQILSSTLPRATLASISSHSQCKRLDAAESWLQHASSRWRRQLQAEPGFEGLEQAPRICLLVEGVPYSDQRNLSIYVRGWQSQNERLTLAHEYLHLALRFHPNGSNEDYIERLARRLLEG